MRLWTVSLMALLLFTGINPAANAGVIIGATRLIYQGDKKESSLNITNPDSRPYLVQSWIEPAAGESSAPFIITPPLFRLDGGNGNRLRVVRTGGNLPQDRESLYWMNIKTIPASSKSRENKNALQIAIKTRIKLLYRPVGITGTADDVSDNVSWSRVGGKLQVNNPTAFYMNFQTVTLGKTKVVDATWVEPYGTASFTLPAGSSNTLSWRLITDYGGIGSPHSSTLK